MKKLLLASLMLLPFTALARDFDFNHYDLYEQCKE